MPAPDAPHDPDRSRLARPQRRRKTTRIPLLGWQPSTWAGLSPNGLGEQKPNHYGEMLKIAWKNRHSLPYAWRILSQGTCDGCALGTAGLHDWTIDGTHLCLVRLNLLELNTMPPMDHRLLADADALAAHDGAALRHLGRLAHPMRRRAGEAGFRRISWGEALDVAAAAFRRGGPDRAGLYLTSRGLTNEVYYAAQKAWRGAGSPHLDNAARVCHSPSTAALKDTIGVGATTCSYTDLFETDLIVLLGSDVANNQPVMMKYLLTAKRNGARLVVVNPYDEPGLERYWVPSDAESALFGTTFRDDHFAVRTGGDLAFLTATLKVLAERGAIDADFIAAHTTGWDDLSAHLATLDWAVLEASSGLARADAERFADLVAGADRAILIWSMGITQHRHGADNVRAIVNLALARGLLGRDGCGLMPIRGHSGVQGGAEMGAYAGVAPGGRPLDAAVAAELGAEWGFAVPHTPARNGVELVAAAGRGEVDLLWSSGGNFLDVLPDPAEVRHCLERVPVRVHADIVVTSQMLVPAAEDVILLPVMTRYEQPGGGTETTTERRIVYSPTIDGPKVGEARAEWRIFGDFAAAVRHDRLASFTSAQQIRDEIARVVPAYAGIETLAATGDAVQWGGRHLCAGGEFPTPDGRGGFRVLDLPDDDLAPGQFRVSTRRGKQFNSMVQAETDALTGAHRDDVFMHPDDAAELGVAAGDHVVLRNATGELRCRVKLSRIARRNLAVHWPEGNVILAAGPHDPESGVPDYNAIVTVAPLSLPEG